MAAYSLYDVLRHLIEKTQWPSEEDKRAATASVNEAETLRILGNLAGYMECQHDTLRAGRCVDCGRTIEIGRHLDTSSGPPPPTIWR